MRNLSSNYGFWPVAVLYILAVLVVWPFAEFPVNDDWAYARAALNLAQGNWQYTDWQGTPLISQALYGALWIKVFGFSFAVLRVSMMCVAWLGAYFVFRIFRDSLAAKRTALMASVVMLFNPLIFHLSLSFMTDIFALTCMLGAFFYLQKLSKSNVVQITYLLLAAFFVLAGVLCRQTVLIIPVAFVLHQVANILHPKKINRQTLLLNFALTGLGFGALIVHNQLYLQSNASLPANYGFQFEVIAAKLTERSEMLWGLLLAGYYLSATLIFVGIGLLPLAAIRWGKVSIKERIIFVLLAAIFTFRAIISPHGWPFTGDVWHPQGVGAMLFEGANSNDYAVHPIIGAILGLLAALSLAKLYNRFKVSAATLIAVLAVLPASINYLSDRYFVVAFVFLLVAAAPFFRTGRKRHHMLLIPLMLMCVYSVYEQHFFHRSRYAAAELVEFATQEDIKPVNFGFEWNGWTQFDFALYNPYAPERSFVEDYDYCISPADTVDGYKGIHAVMYSDALGLRRKTLRIWNKVRLIE